MLFFTRSNERCISNSVVLRNVLNVLRVVAKLIKYVVNDGKFKSQVLYRIYYKCIYEHN